MERIPIAAFEVEPDPDPRGRKRWFKWRKGEGGAEACLQSWPGTGWTKIGGPYLDPGCKTLERKRPRSGSA
jgi:hypothetical protein